MRNTISANNATRLAELTRVQCGWITQVAWSPDGGTLAVAGAEHVQLYVGNFGGQPNHTLTGHSGHIKGIAFSPNAALLASVSADTTVKLWNVANLNGSVNEIDTLKGHQNSVDGVIFSPDGRHLATCGADGIIIIWDVDRRERRAVLDGHEAEAASIGFALGSNILVSGGRDNRIYLWDVGAETRGTIIGEHEDWVRQISVNPPGTMIASASKDETVQLWDALSGEKYAVIYAHPGGADSVAFSPDGALMASGGRDNVIRIWYVQQILSSGEANPNNALMTLAAHEKPVMSLAFNPAGTMLASGSGDNTVRLWAVTEGEDASPTRRPGATSILSSPDDV